METRVQVAQDPGTTAGQIDLPSQLSPRFPLLPESYRLEFHPVIDQNAVAPDLYILEITVPRRNHDGLFFTGSGEAWVRTDGGKRKLSGPDLVGWGKTHAATGYQNPPH